MAKFTTIEDLIDEAQQSIVGSPPEHGRVELGTKTLDDRDYWENINLNEDTFQPYLTGKLETLETEVVDGIVYLTSIGNFETYQYSIDALPFVTDPNNDDEIIRLDLYYDKNNNSTEYYSATEGKINYYLYTRESGRLTPDGHIDNYAIRNKENKFDSYANRPGETGFYLFKLNWGDGTTIEYTDKPKLLEESVLLEHFYEKPGFYTISGVVYALFKPGDGREDIGGYERFETNILLNPSKNYEFNLYDYDNFATIGGVDLNSSLIKSSLNNIGINPINPLDDDRASSENIEKLNLLDKLQLFNFLNKVSDSFLDKFSDLLDPYSVIFNNTPNIVDPSDSGDGDGGGDGDGDEGQEPTEEQTVDEELSSYEITLNEISEAGVDNNGIDIDLINFNVNQSEPYIENSQIDLVVFFVTGYDHSPFDVQLRPFITTPENLNIELIEDNSYTADNGTEYRDARYRFTMPSQDVEITATAFLAETSDSDGDGNESTQISGIVQYDGETFTFPQTSFFVVENFSDESILTSGTTVYITDNDGVVNNYTIGETAESISGALVLNLTTNVGGVFGPFTLYQNYPFYIDTND